MARTRTSRPFIAVPAYAMRAGRVQDWDGAAIGTPARYLEALRRAGAQEALLMPVELDDPGEAEDLLDHFDGLLLIGGGDLDPARYGQERHEKVTGVKPERDAFEIALARSAVERDMPVLAICRGHQVLNVAFGGSLEQDLAVTGHGRPGVVGGAEQHPVRITPGTRLAEAMGTTEAVISSHHHQAIDRPGEGVEAVAWAPDGTLEGIEVAGEAWIVGVQWHPEDTAPDDPTQQRLFDTFVAAARAVGHSTSSGPPSARRPA